MNLPLKPAEDETIPPQAAVALRVHSLGDMKDADQRADSFESCFISRDPLVLTGDKLPVRIDKLAVPQNEACELGADNGPAFAISH